MELDIRPNDPRYAHTVCLEWAAKQPDPKPLSQYEREILNLMLEK